MKWIAKISKSFRRTTTTLGALETEELGKGHEYERKRVATTMWGKRSRDLEKLRAQSN